MTSQKLLRTKALVVLIAMFVLGCAAGIGLSAIYVRRATAEVRPLSMRDGDAYLQALDRELRLNQRQAASIGAIIEETRGQYSAICAEARPRYESLRESARGRIRMLLEEDQRRRFDALVSQENCNCPEQRK
jgi:hypothetical protein